MIKKAIGLVLCLSSVLSFESIADQFVMVSSSDGVKGYEIDNVLFSLDKTSFYSTDIVTATWNLTGRAESMSISGYGTVNTASGSISFVPGNVKNITFTATANGKTTTKVINTVVTQAGFPSCKDVLEKNPGSQSGVYTLNINGTSFKTYCEMSLESGGWTLVQVRGSTISSFVETNNISNNYVTTGLGGIAYTINDQLWSYFKANATNIMLESNPEKYGYVSIYKATTQANCQKLGSTLKNRVLFHDETSGCGGTGMDYSYFGAENNIANYLYNESDFFDKFIGGSSSKIISVSGNAYIFVK